MQGQRVFWDVEDRLKELSAEGDPLERRGHDGAKKMAGRNRHVAMEGAKSYAKPRTRFPYSLSSPLGPT